MTENNNGWPDRPGVPLNPERDGWHWVEDTVDGVGTGHIEAVYYAVWDVPIWYRSGKGSPITKPKEWRYLGPCLTPEEIAAKDAEIARLRADLATARLEGMEAMAEKISGWHEAQAMEYEAQASKFEKLKKISKFKTDGQYAVRYAEGAAAHRQRAIAIRAAAKEVKP